MLQFNDLARALMLHNRTTVLCHQPISTPIAELMDNHTRDCVTDWRDNKFTIIRKIIQ
jgi:hypothetical protein